MQAPCAQATPLAAGVGIAAAAFIGREVVKQYIKFKAAPAAARAYYKVSAILFLHIRRSVCLHEKAKGIHHA